MVLCFKTAFGFQPESLSVSGSKSALKRLAGIDFDPDPDRQLDLSCNPNPKNG
jgi:hypothetical protein